ncbi:NUDIX domain-containing protein [Solwaraspora sp. WMMD406]|uniref:NUDIX domain-containing protein n=1 Tax=Solwaraspora sp. WMMD406 TaxID=3016095 RepID=UPI0024171533|nr:NUDIX domain-containing protein [Solwaraspora sp. WMMD406]MDG4768011.1 NUDIX domain-containing protein [Solwaraspora sp. WMMD406]
MDARIAGVILVDPAGRLLLQLRDGNTSVDPYRWCLPGGNVDPGEDPLTAAHRELIEETGLKVQELRLFWRGLAPSAKFPDAVGEFSIFYAPTDATDEDVVCGEGAAMRFVAGTVVRTLEFGRAYGEIVPRFLDSPLYRELITAG